eukprot:13337472-Alexandrium_andersonii.AAC.1
MPPPSRRALERSDSNRVRRHGPVCLKLSRSAQSGPAHVHLRGRRAGAEILRPLHGLGAPVEH